MVDADCAEADRTLNLRSFLERRADPVVCVVAATGWRDLVCRRSSRTICAAQSVCVWLGTGPGFYVPDQPFRLVRTAPGLASLAGPTGKWSPVYDSRPIQARPTSALRRLVVRVLDDARDDGRAPALLNCYDSLHPAGDPIRRTRPGARTWRNLRTVSSIRADARAGASQARFKTG